MASSAWIRATPPPATVPSSMAARVADTASSMRCLWTPRWSEWTVQRLVGTAFSAGLVALIQHGLGGTAVAPEGIEPGVLVHLVAGGVGERASRRIADQVCCHRKWAPLGSRVHGRGVPRDDRVLERFRAPYSSVSILKDEAASPEHDRFVHPASHNPNHAAAVVGTPLQLRVRYSKVPRGRLKHE
jgi:hypothetical protein